MAAPSESRLSITSGKSGTDNNSVLNWERTCHCTGSKSVLVTTYLLNVHKKYSTLNYFNLLFVSKAQRNEILF